MDGLVQVAKWGAAVALVAVLVLTASAQENGGILRDVHAHGSAGFTYDREWTQYTTGSSPGQEFSLDVNGALFNPNFLSFGTDLSFGHFSDNLNSDSLGSGTTIAGSATLLLLPSSSYPLTVTWQRVRVGLGFTGTTTTTNQDRLGFDWRVQRAKLPKMAFHYETDSTSSDIPVGTFSLAESKGTGFSFTAMDNYKGFDWSAGWQLSNSSSQEMLLEQVLPLDQNYSILWGNVTKHYWGNKGTFNYNFSRDVTSSDLGTVSTIDGVLTTHNASTTINWTSKLTTAAYFQYYGFDNHGQTMDLTSPDQLISIVDYPSSGYSANGMVLYQLTKHLSLSDTTGYSTANNDYTTTNPNGTPVAEQAQSFFTSYPAVNANFIFKRIRFNASYGLGYMRTITTLGRSFGSLNNVGSISGSWSRPWLTLSGNFSTGTYGIGVMPGAYTNNTNYGLTADTTKFQRIGKLRFRYLVFNQEMLGGPGWVQSHTNQWGVTLTRRRWQVDMGHNNASGAHQAYDLPVVPFEPLPPLVGVPLLNDTYHSWFMTVSGQPRRNLNISGTYRKTTNDIVLTGGSADYSLYEINAEYRIGKVMMQAMYGHYLNVSNALTGSWGAGANIMRFRIVRTFNLF